jgi:hypothetical protein
MGRVLENVTFCKRSLIPQAIDLFDTCGESVYSHLWISLCIAGLVQNAPVSSTFGRGLSQVTFFT